MGRSEELGHVLLTKVIDTSRGSKAQEKYRGLRTSSGWTGRRWSGAAMAPEEPTSNSDGAKLRFTAGYLQKPWPT